MTQTKFFACLAIRKYCIHSFSLLSLSLSSSPHDPTTIITPLQVSTPTGTKFFACRTSEEREKWMECIRKTVQPNLEMARRKDNTLTIWILEAKCVSAKKKYFCEVILDRNLFARTTSKQKVSVFTKLAWS